MFATMRSGRMVFVYKDIWYFDPYNVESIHDLEHGRASLLRARKIQYFC